MKFVLLIWLATIIKCNEGKRWKDCYPTSCQGERHTLCEYEVKKKIYYRCYFVELK